LTTVKALFEQYERRDPAEIPGSSLPEFIEFKSQRDFVRKVLIDEVNLRSRGTEYVDRSRKVLPN
jgi:hypothetical protein